MGRLPKQEVDPGQLEIAVGQYSRKLALKALRIIWRLLRYRAGRLILPLHRQIAPAGPVVRRIDRFKMLLNLGEAYNRNLFYKGTRYIEEYPAWCGAIRQGMTVVDIGANIGLFTLAAARLTGPQGKVIAFEPLPRIYQILRANIALNNFRQVQAEPLAVSDQDGVLQLHAFGTDNLSLSPSVEGTRGIIGTFEVSSSRLDTYLATNGIDRVDVVKIDVEGAEKFVLRGMQGTLSNSGHRPVVILEVHPDLLASMGCTAGEVLEELARHGYELTWLERDRRARIRSRKIDNIALFKIPLDPAVAPMNKFRIVATPAPRTRPVLPTTDSTVL